MAKKARGGAKITQNLGAKSRRYPLRPRGERSCSAFMSADMSAIASNFDVDALVPVSSTIIPRKTLARGTEITLRIIDR